MNKAQEKRFDREFARGDFTGEYERKIKQFISEELSNQKKKIIEELEKAEVECSGSCGAGCEYAVQDLIKQLNETN